jgi:hypothetical protein
MYRALTCLLVSGVVSLAACGDNSTAPEDELTADEVGFLASQIEATFTGVLDDYFDQTGGDPSNAPALTHVPVVWTRSFERSRPCHDGGTLTVTGGGTTTWDAQAVTNDVESSGTKTRTNCAYTQTDGVVITLNGTGTWDHERHYLNNAPTGTWITMFAGSFTWTRPGETGDTCTYDLIRTVDTAANTRTLIGTSCGNDVDKSGTWRG